MEVKTEVPVKKVKLLRCVEWLANQNNQEAKKNITNKNDIQFIIDTNNDRTKFLLAHSDDVSVPTAVDETPVKPEKVPLHRLRVDNLRLECEFQSCGHLTSDYEAFVKHVKTHISNLHAVEENGVVTYTCLWDACGHQSTDFTQMIRHVNYHAYHAKLLAIGFNGRATLQLASCKRSSSKRNQMPDLKFEHCCYWTDCDMKFNGVQDFFDHVKAHCNHAERVCSWAGCGTKWINGAQLCKHVRTHTRERVIACYHCGMHFSTNRKLSDHLARQNIDVDLCPFTCNLCGAACATERLLRDHEKQHVSAFACALCDMSAPSLATLAQHVRYRHLATSATRLHACPQCDYRAITKSDLRKHLVKKHKRKDLIRRRRLGESEEENSEGDDAVTEDGKKVKKKSTKKYVCHICPSDKNAKMFSRGSRLTYHLVNEHGAQSGHSRFRYQMGEDGLYRLTITRYEMLEVSEKIVDGYNGVPKPLITNNYEYNLKQTAKPTEKTPTAFEITLKDTEEPKCVKKEFKNEVEIEMCDVDEFGNVINTETMMSDVISQFRQ